MLVNSLFDFFMDGVSVTVGTEFFDLHSTGGIPAVFSGGITGNPC